MFYMIEFENNDSEETKDLMFALHPRTFKTAQNTQ